MRYNFVKNGNIFLFLLFMYMIFSGAVQKHNVSPELSTQLLLFSDFIYLASFLYVMFTIYGLLSGYKWGVTCAIIANIFAFVVSSGLNLLMVCLLVFIYDSPLDVAFDNSAIWYFSTIVGLFHLCFSFLLWREKTRETRDIP